MTRQSQPLLPKIKSPQDIKDLRIRELNQLAQEIRQQIVNTVASNGGHLSSNLGVVELTVALHHVFNSPEDKIVWDVGHQCYAHKLVTGRLEAFPSLRKKNGLSGFPKLSESSHDAFNTGHASTSISAALGLLAAERTLGGKGLAIAVIGDGALTGGLAYEALSHAGHLRLPLIVILNDNKMSISPNVGGLSKYLSRLSMKANYQTFRRHFDAMAKKIPYIGSAFFNLVQRLKRAVKAVFYTDNFFVDLGFEYVGPIGGHNFPVLIEVLEDVRKLNRPVVIHVITRKGKGYNHAENDPGSYHGVGSFSVDGGINNEADDIDEVNGNGKRQGFTESFSSALLEAAKKDTHIVAVTAAMRTGTGLSAFANVFPKRFYDVGIAEEHAVTFAAGLAARGLRPVVAIYSTFIQRAVDQIIHDTALQKLPVIFALDRAGFVSADGETHQGLFDISLFRSAPNTTILSPASDTEMRLILNWALEQSALTRKSGPVIIRYPKADTPLEHPSFSTPLEKGRGVFLSKNENAKVCLFFTGSLFPQALEAAAILKFNGITADLYNLRFLKPIDEDYLAALLNAYNLAVFIEEGIKDGGFGEYAASLAKQRNCSAAVTVLAAESGFLEENRALGTRKELLALNGLDGRGIADGILNGGAKSEVTEKHELTRIIAN
ncbi:MAG: 1-deoxy-D-xylulose-5-phosphate synthase [Treponema sp.]|jgi:1-deoxy-D-xylulose-5-phosphate synthase|nr:1-deoxy-D-xylulose-5-phosphate synthase [Treponema sp.]